MVNIQVADFTTREIFYRLDQDAPFQSLGVQSIRSQMTGQPLPVMTFNLPGPSGATHDVEVKYIDGKGQEHGPYAFRFDPKVEYVRETKDILRLTPDWISFREFPEGRMLVYFTHLLGSRNAFSEIRYSIDSDALDRKVRYTHDWSQKGPPPDIAGNDENPITVPMTTKYVAVKLFYIDGTESEMKRFVLSEVGVDR